MDSNSLFWIVKSILFHFVTCFYPEKLITYVKNIIMEKTKKELQWRTCWKTLGEGRERWVVVLQICESNIRTAKRKKNTHLVEGGSCCSSDHMNFLFDWFWFCFVCWRIACVLYVEGLIGCVLFIGELITCVLFVGELIACVLVVVVMG